MSVQRSRFLLRIKEDLTGELRSCLHLVSIHDIGLKLTFGKLSREFDDYNTASLLESSPLLTMNTVYFLDPETDMDFDRS